MAAPAISFGGLASGIDSGKIIDALMGVAQNPKVRLAAKQIDLDKTATKFDDLKGRLSALQAAAKALDATGGTTSPKATSTDETVIKATAANGAATTSYDVTVEKLARAGRVVSNGVSDASAAGVSTAGTLSIQVGTATAVDVVVTGTESLTELANKINTSGAGVTAGVVRDGTSWKLQVTGKSTGLANEIAFTETGSSLGLDAPANRLQSARDAEFTVSGMSVTSASNVVDDAIQGVTLDLRKESATAIRVDISPDIDALTAKVQTFVKAYGDVERFIDIENMKPVPGQKQSPLATEASVRGVQTTLRSTLQQSFAGRSKSLLSQIGVSFDREGTLSVDTTKLADAVKRDPSGVAGLLGSEGGGAGLMKKVSTAIDGFITGSTGSITSRSASLRSQSKRITSDLDRMDERLDKYESTLRSKYAALESLVSSLQSQGQQMASILGSNNSSK